MLIDKIGIRMDKKFIHDAYSEKEANVIAFGVPLGKNSEEMLSSLRENNWYVEFFNIEKRKNPLERVRVCDIGNIEIKNLDSISHQTKKIFDEGKIPLVLGKSHLLTLYVLKAVKENTKIIIFDAHSDLADEYVDEKIIESVENSGFKDEKTVARFNCYTWLRRFCESAGTKNICLIGTRASSEEEFRFIEQNKILYFTPNRIKKNLEDVKRKLKDFVGGYDVYVSLDVDAFDPSIAPAVDHPEPSGILFSEFLEMIEVLNGKIVGLDLVEISPIKSNRVTEFLAVRAVFEILSHIKTRI